MATKNEPSPYAGYDKAAEDEPIFTLLARDWRAPILVSLWAALYEQQSSHDTQKCAEARVIADKMLAWRLAH